MEKETIRIISYIIAVIIVIITLVIFAFMGLNIYYYGDTRTMLQLLALFGITMICEIGSYIFTFHTAFDEDIISYFKSEPIYDEPEYDQYPEPDQYTESYDSNQQDEYIEPESNYDYTNNEQYNQDEYIDNNYDSNIQDQYIEPKYNYNAEYIEPKK